MNMPSQQKQLSLRTCKNIIWFVMTWKGCPKRGPSDIPNWTWFLASQIKTSITEYLILQGLGRCGCPTYDGWSSDKLQTSDKRPDLIFCLLAFWHSMSCLREWPRVISHWYIIWCMHTCFTSGLAVYVILCTSTHDCAWSPGMKWTPHRCISQNAGDPKTLWKWWIQAQSYRFRGPYFETYQSYFWCMCTTSSD